MHLGGIFIYPVKSLGGCAVPAAELDELGFIGDRRFMVVDAAGRFLTQRTLPRMALIRTALTFQKLTLSAANYGAIDVARATDPTASRRSVTVWKSEGLTAEDCGDLPAEWLGTFLGVHCRLVRIGRDFARPVLDEGALRGDVVSFADSCPFLAISESSLADLNDRLAEREEDALPMDRFRPNLVVTGCPAYAEDTWPRFRIGDVTFRSVGPCARCVVTTTDQRTAARGKEPLRTLATYRRDATDPGNVNFGQNLIHETKSGMLRVGDTIEVMG